MTYNYFYSKWIEPTLNNFSSLSLKEIRLVLNKLRGEGRKELFSILKNNLKTIESKDINKEEMRFGFFLQILDDLERNLEKPFDLERIRPEELSFPLLNLQIEKNKKASCTTQLFFSPSARYFTHGPDIVAYAALLAEQILEPNETIVELGKVSWSRLTINNLSLNVWELALKDSLKTNKGVYASSGFFRTSKGRTLCFTGEEIDGNPIVLSAKLNKIAYDLLVPIQRTQDEETVCYKLNSLTLATKAKHESLQTMLVTLDLIGTLVGWVESPLAKRFLCTQMKNVVFPRRIADLNGASIYFTSKFTQKRKSKKANLFTVPFEVRIDGQEQFSCQGIYACSNESVPEILASLI